MSFKAFLDWYDEGSRREWVDGEVLLFTAPSRIHQKLTSFLNTLLRTYADLRGPGTVVPSPFGMRLRDGRSLREPDLLFVTKEHGAGLAGQWLESPADLVIELVFNDSVTRDGRDKLAEYAAAGILKYWLIDLRPDRQRAKLFRFGNDSTYRDIELDTSGRYHAMAMPGLWVEPYRLWQDPPPNPPRLMATFVPGW
ncbi:MAG: Uma2 family endonuclease [Chloroflexota bacterium]|nr:Uma2 family endonuclease [Chloroflexota bacterium]